jgi:hypothetical protein
MKDPTGFYRRYRSQFDGRECVILISCVGEASKNDKTGDMLQVSFVIDSHPPHVSQALGLDLSVCGQCKRRPCLKGEGFGDCYVTTAKSTYMAWKSYRSGGYEHLDYRSKSHRKAIAKKPCRLGAYGDPASAPWGEIDLLNRHTGAMTGYTHAWENKHAQSLQAIIMASVDSADEYRRAKADGWRCFLAIDHPLLAPTTAIQCPASANDGKIKCRSCKLCGGATIQAPDIWIETHGIRSENRKRKEGIVEDARQ